MAVQSVKELIVYKEHAHAVELNHEVGKMLGAMIRSPEKFLTTRH